jgi:Big-like domain-containing protein
MGRWIRVLPIVLILLFGALAPAHAGLERMGPVSVDPTIGGYPTWFQDGTGLTMEFCNLLTAAELSGGWCVLIPPGPVYPEAFPGTFFNEHFYHRADALMKDATVKARLTMGVEASFLTPLVIPGDQMTFGRIRVLVNPLPFDGTYTVYHPYGVWTFPGQVAGDRLFFTEDIGVACPGTFGCTLGTSIGPFLLPSPAAGGPEVPPIPDLVPGLDPFYDILVNTGATTPYPGTGKKYIADPARLGPVTGSPLPPFVGNDGVSYNHNTFRIEGPNGWVLQTDNFQLGGRVMTGAIPGKVTVDRASYTASASGNKLEAFATAFETTQGRVPAQQPPAPVAPILSFYDAPCGGALTIDPVTGAVTVNAPPYTAPAGANELQMSSAGRDFYGQTAPAAIPSHVCVEDYTARNAAGQLTPAFYLKAVTDDVTITQAVWNPANGGSLTVSATSSDTVQPPALTVAEYGDLVNGSFTTAAPLAAPPAKVQVVSSSGGSAELIVSTGVGMAQSATIPVATNDHLTMFEDCSATPASGCAAPLVIDALANDTLNGGPIPAGAILTLTQAPRLGAAVINADNTITYTPNPDVNGSDLIGYTVAVNGVSSNQAFITIAITPVNDAPTAVNDRTGAVVSRSNKVNVIANDTDPDGAADLADAVIATWPAQLGVKPTPVNGVITFTPTSTGTFTFTYQAKDKAGALSANTATVTVVVSGSEAIVVTKAIYKQGNIGGGIAARWTVAGTDSVLEGQTLTIVYNNGSPKTGTSCNGTAANPACVIGTTTVDGLGNFLLDFVLNPGGSLDPTDATAWNTKPTAVKVFSSAPVLGGSGTLSIQLK